jgi:threonine efflux protein
MALFFSLVGLLLVHLVAVTSPGPAFLNVSRHSLRYNRRSALACAGGTAAASIFWAVAATFGLAALLSQAAWLYQTLKLIGGCYLIWLGIQSWCQAGSPVSAETRHGRARLPGPHCRLARFQRQPSQPKDSCLFQQHFRFFSEPGLARLVPRIGSARSRLQ